MKIKKIATLFCLACLAYIQGTVASGFALIEQSVSDMGTAYAGAGAVANDATTVFFNPAGMVRLHHREAVFGAHLVMPTAYFTKEVAEVNPAVAGVSLTGGDGGNAGDIAAVPHFYAVQPCGDNIVFGLGINSPFGLSTSYDADWVGRYYGITSKLFTMNLNPCAAIRLNRCLSIGIGLDVMYLNADLTNKIDCGYIDSGNPALSQTADGFAKLKGDSWAVGGNAGILYEHSPCTRLGVNFRSGMRHNIGGQVQYQDIPTGGTSEVLFTNAKAWTVLNLPATVSISAFHQYNNCWAFLADVTWTNWQVLDQVVFDYDSVQSDTVLTFNWKNSWRYSIGATYTMGCNWILRAGFAYDQTPIPSPELRSVRIPGEDRLWLALGAGYHLSSCLMIDVGYAHLFVRDPELDRVGTADPANPDFFLGELKGKYQAHTDIVSAQVRYVF